MNSIKKFTTILIAILMLNCLCSCTNSKTETQSPVAQATRIVVWNFNSDIPEEDRDKLIKDMNENMLALVGKIDGLVSVDYCGLSGEGSDREVVLITKFESFEDIAPYTTNELHLNVGATYFKPYLTERLTVNIPQ